MRLNSSLASSLRTRLSTSAMSVSAAYAPPTTAPMLVPVMTSIGIPSRRSARSTPMWASPRAAPPRGRRQPSDAREAARPQHNAAGPSISEEQRGDVVDGVRDDRGDQSPRSCASATRSPSAKTRSAGKNSGIRWIPANTTDVTAAAAPAPPARRTPRGASRGNRAPRRWARPRPPQVEHRLRQDVPQVRLNVRRLDAERLEAQAVRRVEREEREPPPARSKPRGPSRAATTPAAPARSARRGAPRVRAARTGAPRGSASPSRGARRHPR